MTGPLEGLRVVDCTRGNAGPRLTWLLADYGADVIWVEPPGGDPYREELAVPYSVYGRNKRSVVLDLATDQGKQSLDALLATSDVFVQSWRPGVAEKLGLGWDELHQRFPELVACSLSGYGPDSPHADLPGHEALVQAVSGLMGAQMGHREAPIYVGLPVASNGAAYIGLIGVLAALYRRESDGHGRHVETSLLDGTWAYLSQAWGYSDALLSKPMMLGGARFVSRTFQCSDGEWLGVCTFGRGGFDRFTKAMGVEDKFQKAAPGADVTAPLAPEELEVLHFGLPEVFAMEPRKVWIERLLEADIAAIPVLRQGEVFDEPQTVHNKMVLEVDDPVLGRVQQAAHAVRFGTSVAATVRPAPTPGQHTDEVLAELATTVPRESRISGPADERPLLDGVRILDLGHWYAGPYSSRLLADLGADVLKLEPPTGDGMRGFERAFSAAQAGKRAISADLKAPELAALRERLLQWADVVQHNLRPGVAERLGLSSNDVEKANPNALYLNAPGWGSTGPDALRQSFAPLMSGYVGAAYEIGGQYNAPGYPSTNEDTGAGMLGAIALLMGLLHRARTGVAQSIELPQLNSTITDVAHIVRRTDGTVLGHDALDPLQMGTHPLRRLYRTEDGWLCLVAMEATHVEALGRVLGIDLRADEQFATAQQREENAYRIENLLMDRFSRRTTADLLASLRDAGVPVVVPALNNNLPTMDDPLNLRLGRVADLEHPRYGHVREPGVFVRVGAAEVPEHRRAPEFGEHTEEVLRWAGYDETSIADLRTRAVVR